MRYVIPYLIERGSPGACSHARPQVERRRFSPAYDCHCSISSIGFTARAVGIAIARLHWAPATPRREGAPTGSRRQLA